MSKSIVGLLIGKVIVDQSRLMGIAPGTSESDCILYFRTKTEREIVAITDDLLEACENALAWIEDVAPEPMVANCLRAAIAKARGEETP